jgi:hypothetical protein
LSADCPGIGGVIVRANILLPEPVHRRLMLRAAVERATMQALIRAALAPLLAEGATPPCWVVDVVNPPAGDGRPPLPLGLVAAPAAGGERALLVDLDPEAGLTRGAGLEPGGLATTIADLLAPVDEAPKRAGAVLRPLNERRCRLQARARKARGLQGLAYLLTLEIPHFVMERKLLLGIKSRAGRAERGRSCSTPGCPTTMQRPRG